MSKTYIRMYEDVSKYMFDSLVTWWQILSFDAR